jgi:farnesyl-diphosphate farnesyltransferase
MDLRKDALSMLEATSRTFYIPIMRLPSGLQEAVASAYLCMRAIDEVEDHPTLDNQTKAMLLRRMSLNLQASTERTHNPADFARGLSDIGDLPEVSLRIGEWAMLAPGPIAPRVWDATAAMADRMAYWAEQNWTIHTEAELDAYTFSVAGAVGLLLSDLWAWYDGTKTDRAQAIGFGRGLQSVNILRNTGEDEVRGVSFFPDDWTTAQMHDYAKRNLDLADLYTNGLTRGPVQDFCKIPLVLARGTLNAMMLGQLKLSRSEVMALVQRVLQPV